MLGDQLEDPLRGRALREDDPGGADAERVERGQVARVAEEELRHRQDDVVLADSEHALRVPVVAQHRAVHGMDGALRLAGAARRELPERDVVLRRRRGLELVRYFPEARMELLAHDEYVPFARDLPDRSLRGLVRHHDLRVGVLEVVGVVLRLEERVRLGGDGSDLLGSVPERDEVHGIAEDEEHPVLCADAELQEQVPAAVDEACELAVGGPAVRADQGGAIAAALLHVAVDEPGREVQLVRQVGMRDHAATSRISSTSMSVSVSNVSRPSSGEASAGAPQYA